MNELISDELFLSTYSSIGQGLVELKKLKERKVIPLFPSKELAELCGHLMGDGSLHYLKEKNKGAKIRFYGSDYKLKKIQEIYLKLFNEKPKIFIRKKDGLLLIDHPDASIARCFILLGIPTGEKVLKEFSVPNWIMKGDLESQRGFLQALFDDELGGIYFSNKSNKWNGGLRLRMNKDKDKVKNLIDFFNQLQKMLSNFGIISNPIQAVQKGTSRKDGFTTKSISFIISNKMPNRVKFYKEIGFIKEPNKQKSLYISLKNSLNCCGSAGAVKPKS